MAVTNTNTFTVTRNDIINSALRILGVVGIGETPQTEDYVNCSQALNIMIKAWAKKGWPLFTVKDLAISLVSGVRSYPIGPTAAYVYSIVASGGSGYVAGGTWTAVGGTLGTVSSGTYTVVAGVVLAMTVVVPGDSYTSVPTSYTLSGAGTGATFVTTLVGLTTNKPTRALTAYVRDVTNIDSILLPVSKEEYDLQAIKNILGIPNQFYYDNQLANGILNVIPVPVIGTSTLYLAIQRMFSDMTVGTDNFDFPQEWFQPLKWGLAAELAVEYGIDIQMVPYYDQKATFYLEESFDYSVEDSSVYFSMDKNGY